MKRFVVVCILFVCVLAISGARNAVAADRAAIPGRLTGKQNEEAKIPSQMTESVRATPASIPSQSSRDVLPGGGVIIVAPGDAYAWQVWPGGRIDFSFDSGHTWVSQKSGVTTDLTAGSSPSDKVCWVVGKAGTVLLTTDRGKHWKQVASPTKEDLEGVYAQDGKRASIWTASHKQSFETNDGGMTWAPNVDK